jgi:hypothetical protein
VRDDNTTVNAPLVALIYSHPNSAAFFSTEHGSVALWGEALAARRAFLYTPVYELPEVLAGYRAELT